MEKYFWYAIFFIIAFWSKGQLCFLALIVLIAFNEKLLDDTLLNAINGYCGVKFITMHKNEKKDVIDEKEEQEQLETIKEKDEVQSNVKQENEIKKRWNGYISQDGILKYSELEKEAIVLINKKTSLNFKSGEKLLNKYNNKTLYPDAISKKIKNKYILAEVKATCYGKNKTVLERGITSLCKYVDFINDLNINEAVDFYLILVLDDVLNSINDKHELENEFLKRMTKHNSNYQYELFVFTINDLKSI